MGMDQITTKFLKEGADVLAYPLAQMTNLYVKMHVFPKEQRKITKLKPLFKKGSKTNFKNYRSISPSACSIHNY